MGRHVAIRSTTLGLRCVPRRAQAPPGPEAGPLRGVSEGARPPRCPAQSPQPSPEPLGWTHRLCRAPGSSYGPQYRSTGAAQPGRGAQELLWLWAGVERASGRDEVQCAANDLAVGAASPPWAACVFASLCGPWWQKPGGPQGVSALADDARTPSRVDAASATDA